MITEPVHLSQESTNNLLQNVTRYVIPEACAKIAYSIVSEKHHALRDPSIICKTRVTYVTLMTGPYLSHTCVSDNTYTETHLLTGTD